jgi:hypothetical protein
LEFDPDQFIWCANHLAGITPDRSGITAASPTQMGILIVINFVALRQAMTPEPMLGRMTSTMLWLIVLPAGPGALLGG